MLGGHSPRRRLNNEGLPRGRSECNVPSRGGNLQDTRTRSRRRRAQSGGGRLRGGRSGKKRLLKYLLHLMENKFRLINVN